MRRFLGTKFGTDCTLGSAISSSSFSFFFFCGELLVFDIGPVLKHGAHRPDTELTAHANLSLFSAMQKLVEPSGKSTTHATIYPSICITRFVLVPPTLPPEQSLRETAAAARSAGSRFQHVTARSFRWHAAGDFRRRRSSPELAGRESGDLERGRKEREGREFRSTIQRCTKLHEHVGKPLSEPRLELHIALKRKG